MVILVTGATGYIGSKLAVRLAEGSDEVRLLCRRDPDIDAFRRPNIHIVRGDINDPESLANAMRGVQQVYHLAAYARIWAKDPSVFEKINVEGTRNVLQAARQAGVERIVYTSTAGVIGPSGDHPMREEDKRITGYFNPYEETKARAEALALDFARQGLNLCILNPSRVYGPGFDTGSNPFTKIVEMYFKGNWKITPGNGEDIGSYCFIDDVVEGHVLAMQKGRSGERYIFGGDNATFNQFMQLLKEFSGIDRKLKNVPFGMLRIFSHIQVIRARLTGKPPLITPDWVRKYDYDWALDSSKAQRELGYNIRPLRDGMAITVEWVRQNRL